MRTLTVVAVLGIKVWTPGEQAPLALTPNHVPGSPLRETAAPAAPSPPAIQLAVNARDKNARGFLCGRLPGEWTLSMGDEVVIRRNGTANHSFSGVSGNWGCTGRNVVVHWQSGAIDQGVLSADGNHMSGTSMGIAWSADRKSSGAPSDNGASNQLTPLDFMLLLAP